MDRSNLFNHLLRLFDEGLSMKTTELEFGTLEVTVENRSQEKQITFFAKGMEDAKQKAQEWQVGQMLLNCDDFEEIVMFLAQRNKLKAEMKYG
jgi:hypothetical protein|nr:MAG TPA_asm: PcfM DpnD/PcfM-like protein [Caudoviricetes sp.]